MSIHDERSPLLKPAGEAMLRRLLEHPDAPRFNYATGDRLHREDLDPINKFRERLYLDRGPRSLEPPGWLIEWIEQLGDKVPYLRRILRSDRSLLQHWAELPTTCRADVALRPWEFVPDDEPLERLIIYRTAGTTGHPISVPHHPLAVRCYEPLIEFAIAAHGIQPVFSADRVACILVGSQIRTYTYATVLYNWAGAGFAKVNLRQTEWPSNGSQGRYMAELSPQLLTGDPISFAEMMHLDINVSPVALVTTSVAMSPSLKQRLSARYRAPVIDWYSMVETGPVGYACPLGHGYHLLPHDLHVEVLDTDGQPAVLGQRGEVTLSGGRNVYFPLVRYRTGDFGRLDLGRCLCGDPMPRLLDLEGRQPILIRSSDGTPVTTVDLSRTLREFPLLLHEFIQHADQCCDLIIRPLPGAFLDLATVERDLRRLLGDLPLQIRVDPTLGDRSEGKAVPYRSELLLED